MTTPITITECLNDFLLAGNEHARQLEELNDIQRKIIDADFEEIKEEPKQIEAPKKNENG